MSRWPQQIRCTQQIALTERPQAGHSQTGHSPASFTELVRRPLRADLEAWSTHGWHYAQPTLLGVVRTMVRHPGFRATMLHRIAHWASRKHVPGLATLCQQLNVTLHAIEISSTTPIGEGFYMPHVVGSVITAQRIGRGVTLQGGITIGLRTDAEFPILDDGVTVSAGARVLGPIVLGAGVTVGANAVVINDVPPGVTVVGVPARPVGAPGPA